MTTCEENELNSFEFRLFTDAWGQMQFPVEKIWGVSPKWRL